MSRVVRKLVLACAALAASIGVAEVACRLWLGRYSEAQFDDEVDLHGDMYRVVDGSRRGFELKPGALEINSLGLRGRETTEQKPPGTFRILVLGDSITFGTGVKANENFPIVLESLLRTKYGPRVEVLNAGVIGYNTEQELDWLKERGMRLQPDAVVVAHCPNDVHDTPLIFRSGGELRQFRPGENRKLAVPFLVEHSALWRTILAAIEIGKAKRKGEYRAEAGVGFNVLLNPDAQFGALVDLVRFARERSLPLVIVAFPYLNSPFDRYPVKSREIHAGLVRVTRSLEAPLIDLFAVWYSTDHKDWRRPDAPNDFVHPNAAGHRDAARRLADWFIAEKIVDRAAPR